MEKTAAILGVVNSEGLPWKISQVFKTAGAKVFLSYEQKNLSRIRSFLHNERSIQGKRCELLDPVSLRAFFEQFQDRKLDHLVCSPSSPYSLERIIQTARPYLAPAASILAFITPSQNPPAPPSRLSESSALALENEIFTEPGIESAIRYHANELKTEKIRINGVAIREQDPSTYLKGRAVQFALYLSSRMAKKTSGQILSVGPDFVLGIDCNCPYESLSAPTPSPNSDSNWELVQ